MSEKASGSSALVVFTVGAALGVLGLVAYCRFKGQPTDDSGNPQTCANPNLNPIVNTSGSTGSAGISGNLVGNFHLAGSEQFDLNNPLDFLLFR